MIDFTNLAKEELERTQQHNSENRMICDEIPLKSKGKI
jgi:hypothetical protein